MPVHSETQQFFDGGNISDVAFKIGTRPTQLEDWGLNTMNPKHSDETMLVGTDPGMLTQEC